MPTIAAILVAAVVAALLLFAAAAARTVRRGAELRARLLAVPHPRDVSAELPERVRDFALRSDARREDLAHYVRFTQEAEMQLTPGGRWQPMRATQMVVTGAPGFAWQADQDFGPIPKLRILDAYVGGEGRLEVRLLGTVPLVRAGGEDLARGEAMRYLAELPWVPDAILGNPDLNWKTLDEDWVEVSVDVSGVPVAVRFRFGASGDIVELYGPARPALGPGGQTVLRDWQGYFRDYRMIGPRRIPAEGEVGYVTRDGYRAYFQGRIIDYDAAH